MNPAAHSLLELEVPIHQKAFLQSIVEAYEVLEEKDLAGTDSSAPCLECSAEAPVYRCYIQGKDLAALEQVIRKEAGYMSLQLRSRIIQAPPGKLKPS